MGAMIPRQRTKNAKTHSSHCDHKSNTASEAHGSELIEDENYEEQQISFGEQCEDVGQSHDNIDVAKAMQEVAISTKENALKTSEIGAGQTLRHAQAEVFAGTEEKFANNEQSFAIAIPPKHRPPLGTGLIVRTSAVTARLPTHRPALNLDEELPGQHAMATQRGAINIVGIHPPSQDSCTLGIIVT